MIARQRQTYGEEVANVLTHGAGMLLGLTAIVVLMMAAIRSGNPWAIGSFAVYAVCMTLSYVTSTFYHASTHARQKRLLRRFDHSAIYLHIAGTYTPFTLVALRQEGYWGWSLFAIVWIAAVVGVWLSFRKMKKKDHLKTVCYLAMGWVVIIAFKPLLHVFRENWIRWMFCIGCRMRAVLYWWAACFSSWTSINICILFGISLCWEGVSAILYRFTCWYKRKRRKQLPLSPFSYYLHSSGCSFLYFRSR